MWYGKAPGVDRTGDVFKHANYAGVGRNGGVLALAGDDPISKSSTLPSHSEVALYDALMPTIFPGNVQEILDLGLHGFMLSRHSGLWVGVKIVTNVADEAGTAEVSPDRIAPVIPTVELDGKPFRHEINLNLIPPYGLEMERTIHLARLELARRYAWENKLNRMTVPTPGAWLGIMTAGKTYYDVRQALAELGLDDAALRHHGIRILKMGMLFPMEPRIVRDFARGLEEILVVEEKRAFLEMFAKDILYGMPDRPRIVGKADEEDRLLVPAIGELDADLIARAIARRVARKLRIPSVEARIQHLDELKRRPRSLNLARTAFFCSGCPHNRSTVVPEGSVAAAGIGCHGMAMGMNRGIIGVTHMGGEGAQWVGMSPFTETPHLFQNIGDGTLFHSGTLAVSYAIASGVNITYKILYNAAVAMTGGQDAAGAIPIPDLTQLARRRGREADHHHHRRPREVQGRRRGRGRGGLAPRPAPRGAVGAGRDQGRHGADPRPAVRGGEAPAAQARQAGRAHDARVHQRAGVRGLRRLRQEVQLPVRPAGGDGVRAQDADPPVVVQQGLLVPARRLPVVPDRRAHRPAAEEGAAPARRSTSSCPSRCSRCRPTASRCT